MKLWLTFALTASLGKLAVAGRSRSYTAKNTTNLRGGQGEEETEELNVSLEEQELKKLDLAVQELDPESLYLALEELDPENRLLSSNSKRALAPKCVDYTSMWDPKYRECTDGDITVRSSLGFTKNDLCVHVGGKPCRGSYVCPKGSKSNVAVDCRNVLKPGSKCAAVGCDGKCIPYPTTSKQLTFSYDKNKCGKMGWHCLGVGYSLASCYWNTYLPDGKVVRISTNEPDWMIGNPEGLGYYGECYPKINGKSCKSCKIGCTLPGGNYAQFDCSNLIPSSSYSKPKCPA